MNIFSRIFKKEISDREYRFRVTRFHSIAIAYDGNDYPLHNISYSGLAFYAPELGSKLKVDKEVMVSIRLKDKIFDFSGKIIHITNGIIGLRATSSIDKFKFQLRHFFESEIEGLKVRKMDPERLNTSIYKGEPHWYYGDYSHKLFFTVLENRINFFQINYQGYILTLNENGFVSGGLVSEDEEEGKITRQASNLVSAEKKIPKEIFDYMNRFIEVISNLEFEYKKYILEQISEKYEDDWT